MRRILCLVHTDLRHTTAASSLLFQEEQGHSGPLSKTLPILLLSAIPGRASSVAGRASSVAKDAGAPWGLGWRRRSGDSYGEDMCVRRRLAVAATPPNNAMNLTRHRSPASRAPSARAGYCEAVRRTRDCLIPSPHMFPRLLRRRTPALRGWHAGANMQISLPIASAAANSALL